MAMLDLRSQFYRNLTELPVISKNHQTESCRWYIASFESGITPADFQISHPHSILWVVSSSYRLRHPSFSSTLVEILGLVTSGLHHDRARSLVQFIQKAMVAVICHLLSKSTTPIPLGARKLSPGHLTQWQERKMSC